MAIMSGGGDIEPGELVEKYNVWLTEEPSPADTAKAQLLTALGVGP